MLLGVALAYLGRKAEAIREGQRGVELSPISRNAFNSPYIHHQMARMTADGSDGLFWLSV